MTRSCDTRGLDADAFVDARRSDGTASDDSEPDDAALRRELALAQRRLADLQRIARIGTWSYDPETGHLDCTPEHLRLLGLPEDDPAPGLADFVELVHPDDRGRLLDEYGTALCERRDYDVEYRIVRPDGETRWLHARGEVVETDVDAVALHGITQDVTEQHRRERQVVERLEAADRLKDEFLATASHELRTPLTSIVGFASALARLRGSLDEDTELELVTKLERNALELGSMVERLLDFSRLQSGAVSVELRDLPLRETIEACLESHVTTALAAHNVLVDVDDALWVRADHEGLVHVVTNLLTNAAKYSEEGTTIAITARADGPECTVAVTDEGVGIDPANHRRIFDHFYREPHARMAIRGSGIGLAIVRSYTELMGGRVWVDSAPGKGSTFSFTVATAARPADGPADDTPPLIEPLARP